MKSQITSRKTKEKKILSPRQEEVLGLLNGGLSYEAAAKKLGIGKETVRKHASNIYRKLKVHNKTQAMVKYYLAGE